MEGEEGDRTQCPDPTELPQQVQTLPEKLKIRNGRSNRHRRGNPLPTGGQGQATLAKELPPPG